MAALAPELLQWLVNVLTPSYKDVNRTYSDVATTLQAFNTLSPRTDVFTYENGSSELLLCISGILPVNFRGASYNIPVTFWLPHHYPSAPPIALVVPSAGMSIRPTNHVDASGRCYHPYLTLWVKNPNLSFLVDLCAQLKDVFSKEPPVFAKNIRPESPAIPQQPPPRPPLPPELSRPKQEPIRHSPVEHAPSPPPKPPHPHQAPPSIAQQPQHVVAGLSSAPRADVPPPAPPKPVELAHGPGTPSHTSEPFQFRPDQGASSNTLYRSNTLPPTTRSSLPVVRDNIAPGPPAGLYAQQQQQQHYQQQPPLPPLPPLPVNQAPRRPEVTDPNLDYRSGAVQTQTPPPFQPPQPDQRAPNNLPANSQGWQQGQQGGFENQGNAQKPPYAERLAPGPHFPGQQQPAQPPRFPIYAIPPRPVSIHGYPPSNSSPLNPSMPVPKAPEAKKPIIDIMNIDDGFRINQATAPPPLPPSPEKDRLLNEIALALHQRAECARTRALTSLEQTSSQAEAMSRTEAIMERERIELKRMNETCKKDIRILNERMAMAEDLIKEAREREAPNIDAVVVAPTVVHSQLYELVTEDMAIEDTIYVLGKALDRERVTLEVFLKHTRNLAREQFLKRALVKKISKQVGLT